MSLADIRERQRRDVLARLDALQQHNDQTHSDLEQRRAADALGVADRLPEPQEPLEFQP
jgi:hypothetical protein